MRGQKPTATLVPPLGSVCWFLGIRISLLPGGPLHCSPVPGVGHPGAAEFLDSELLRLQGTRPGR